MRRIQVKPSLFVQYLFSYLV
ncbi:MAG: hypothetical protein K0R75_674, partial [Paenibacillaceae bacterium]|nr:hypothetical protein [Paenibacillaceae bacterium]